MEHRRTGTRRAARSIALVITVGLTLLTGAGAAGAGTVADDADEVVRSIVFPAVGSVTFSDTFGACRSGCTRGHEGTDLMGDKLTPLVAARDATVTWLKDTATPDGSQGNYLMLADDEGWEYFYVHINNDSPGTDDGANPEEWIFAPGIERGARVRAGELVGFLGDSGNAESTAPHLHFEIHKPDGTVINPYRSLLVAPRMSSPLLIVGGTDDTTSHEAFVQALSEDFLDRAPSDVERATRLAELATGRSRAEIVDSFAGSDQWIEALIDGYYRSTLGRSADAGGRAHWISVIRAGRTPASVAADFYASDEYHHRVGGTNAAWIEDLYTELLARRSDAGGLDHWTTRLASGTPRHVVALDFYQSLESRRTRVGGLYEALLGRAPDGGGLGHWAGVLADGRDLRLATFLASSDEYQARAMHRFA